MKTALLACAGMLLVAVLPMPYGYYQLLRLVGCALLGWVTYRAFAAKPRQDSYFVGFAILTLLFNPVWPVSLSRGWWVVIDLPLAGFLYWLTQQSPAWLLDSDPEQLAR